MGSGGGRRPVRPAPYDRSDRYSYGARGDGGGGGYDSYSAPRERFGGPGGGRGGRFRGESILAKIQVIHSCIIY